MIFLIKLSFFLVLQGKNVKVKLQEAKRASNLSFLEKNISFFSVYYVDLKNDSGKSSSEVKKRENPQSKARKQEWSPCFSALEMKAGRKWSQQEEPAAGMEPTISCQNIIFVVKYEQ